MGCVLPAAVNKKTIAVMTDTANALTMAAPFHYVNLVALVQLWLRIRQMSTRCRNNLDSLVAIGIADVGHCLNISSFLHGVHRENYTYG
jgi:hypothetical protein